MRKIQQSHCSNGIWSYWKLKLKQLFGINVTYSHKKFAFQREKPSKPLTSHHIKWLRTKTTPSKKLKVMDKGLTPPFTSTNRMTECLAFDPSLAFPDFVQLRSSPDISCPRGSYTIGTQGLRKRSPDLLRPKPVEKETTNVDHFGILQEVLFPSLILP